MGQQRPALQNLFACCPQDKHQHKSDQEAPSLPEVRLKELTRKVTQGEHVLPVDGPTKNMNPVLATGPLT